MPEIITVRCGNCGKPITSSAKSISERKMRNASGQVYCKKCGNAYGGFTTATCDGCGKEFSYRAAAAILEAGFRPGPRRCPDCREGREEAKSLQCHWHQDRVAVFRAGEVIPGKKVGACWECKQKLVALMQGGLARWVNINLKIVGEDQAGFVDPWYNLGSSELQVEDNAVRTIK